VNTIIEKNASKRSLPGKILANRKFLFTKYLPRGVSDDEKKKKGAGYSRACMR